MMNKRQWIVLCLLAAGGVMQAQQWPDTPVEARPGAQMVVAGKCRRRKESDV